MRVLAAAVVVSAMLLSPLFSLNSYAISEEELKYEALKEQVQYLMEKNQMLEEKVERLESGGMPAEASKAEEKKDAWYDKIQVEVKKPGDGLKIKTKDGNYSLRFRLRSQLQLSVTDEDEGDVATNFRVRRLRLTWDGNVFRPWFLYTIQVDADGGNMSLRDAFFDIAYNKMFAPRVGQFKVPFSREELNSSSELQLVERSILNDEFAFGRDRGAALYGVLGNWITYGVGVFNGDGRNGSSADSNLLYAGRVMFTPCCGELKYGGTFPAGGDYKIEPNFGGDKPLLAIGVAAAGIPGLKIDVKTPDNAIDDRFAEIGTVEADVFSATADVNFKWSRFNVEGDYFYRNISPEEGGLEEATDQGFRAQAGFFVLPEFIELAGRFGYIIYDDDIDGRDNAMEITPGVNFYLSKSHKWKLQFSYTLLQEEDTAGEEFDTNVFRTQLQAYF